MEYNASSIQCLPQNVLFRNACLYISNYSRYRNSLNASEFQSVTLGWNAANELWLVVDIVVTLVAAALYRLSFLITIQTSKVIFQLLLNETE